MKLERQNNYMKLEERREREREREGKRGEEASFTKLCHLEPTMFCFVPALSLSVSGEL